MFKRKIFWQLIFSTSDEMELFFAHHTSKVYKGVLGEFLLVKKEKTLHAFKNRCPHQNKPLNGCSIKDEVIICPFHKYQYSIRDGKGHGMCLEKYPTKIEEDKFYVGKEKWSLF